MISKIIVPTDFSEPAKKALEYAIAFASKTEASLHILHVNQVAMVDATMPAETYQVFVNEIAQATEDAFKEIEETLLVQTKLNYKFKSVYGFIAEEICDYAVNEKADLIIMGTTGASGAAEILVGSNAASTVSKSMIPVLVIPKELSFNDFTRIVYATDYNEPEFPALMRLIYFAELFDCRLDVIHVKSDADRYFNAANNFFKKNKDKISYPNIHYIELEEGEVIEKINGYVAENSADLLVMAKHNRSFFDRLFHRSLSKKMAFHTTIPLLILVKE